MHQQIELIRLIMPLVVCFGLAPVVQAVGPDTEGNIPGANNGEGIGVLVSRTTGIWNTGTGFEALNHLTAGNQNTATGLRALFSDTNGGFNTATGVYSLLNNTSGFYNTATGVYSLLNNTSGFNNSATGAYSLANNITGNSNTANGYGALYLNTASFNTATGFGALFSNTVGHRNTANGQLALNRNTTGFANTANGSRALFSNTTGNYNTANGSQALASNTTGGANTASGFAALNRNTTGSNNTALGIVAGGNVTTASNVIAIGAGVSGENVSNTCYIGNIFGATSAGATAVYVNNLGKLGTVVSSRRFKDEIKPMDKASEAILALKPVSFRYKEEIDPAHSPQFGLVAEDVEKVNPDLVVRDRDGKVNTVRYEAVNAMLLNEFLKEHRKVEKLEAKLAEQERKIEALTSGLQRVSAQLATAGPSDGGLEVSKAAPKTALNQ